MDPSGHAPPREGPEPEPEPHAEGTVARLIRMRESGPRRWRVSAAQCACYRRIGHGLWGRQRWPTAGRCRTALRAAQLRLLLGLFQSERLAARCPLELEPDVSGAIAACFRVTLPAPPPAFRGLALGLVSDSGPRRSR